MQTGDIIILVAGVFLVTVTIVIVLGIRQWK